MNDGEDKELVLDSKPLTQTEGFGSVAPELSNVSTAKTTLEANPQLDQAAAKAAAKIRRRFRKDLIKPGVPRHVARIFLRRLQGGPQKPGRKPYPNTTAALRLLAAPELSDLPKPKRWKAIYARVIQNWPTMTPEQRQAAAVVLRDRVRARLRMRRRRQRPPPAKNARPVTEH